MLFKHEKDTKNVHPDLVCTTLCMFGSNLSTHNLKNEEAPKNTVSSISIDITFLNY